MPTTSRCIQCNLSFDFILLYPVYVCFTVILFVSLTDEAKIKAEHFIIMFLKRLSRCIVFCRSVQVGDCFITIPTEKGAILPNATHSPFNFFLSPSVCFQNVCLFVSLILCLCLSLSLYLFACLSICPLPLSLSLFHSTPPPPLNLAVFFSPRPLPQSWRAAPPAAARPGRQGNAGRCDPRGQWWSRTRRTGKTKAAVGTDGQRRHPRPDSPPQCSPSPSSLSGLRSPRRWSCRCDAICTKHRAGRLMQYMKQDEILNSYFFLRQYTVLKLGYLQMSSKMDDDCILWNCE